LQEKLEQDPTAQLDEPQELPHERRRREHEEYKKSRAANPALVPRRAAFFKPGERLPGSVAD